MCLRQRASVSFSLETTRSRDLGCPAQVEFENNIVGTAIPAGYIPACEKGFREACNSGALIGFPVEVRRFQEASIMVTCIAAWDKLRSCC